MTTHRLTVGDPAPPFELPDTDGTPVRLEPARHAGLRRRLHRQRLPVRPRLARPHPGRRPRLRRSRRRRPADRQQRRHRPPRGLRRRRWPRRVAAGELAGPFLRDAEQSAARAYGATATPEVFVVDRAGVVRYHGAPDGDHDDPAQDARWLREALDDVLAGRAVARPLTSPAGCSIKWRVELLWWEGCPTHGQAAEMLARRARRAGPWRGARRRSVRCAPATRRSGSVSRARRPSRSAASTCSRPTPRPRSAAASTPARDGRISPLPDRDDARRPAARGAGPPVGPPALGRPAQTPDRLETRTA